MRSTTIIGTMSGGNAYPRRAVDRTGTVDSSLNGTSCENEEASGDRELHIGKDID